MRLCISKKITLLSRDEQGATAIEFAFAFPVLLLFIFGIFEFGLIMHVSSLVENAAHDGSRLGITGNSYEDLNPEGMSREDFIEQYMRKRIGLWIRDDEQIVIKTTVLGSIDDLGKTNPGGTQPGGLGGGGQAVIYNINYFWRTTTPFLSQIIGNERGEVPIHSTVVVKNEDFCGRRNCF